MTPCAICTVHKETRSTSFLVEPQNQGRRFASGLASKILERFLPVQPQNQWYSFSQFVLNTGGDGFLGLPSKTSGRRFVGCATKPTERGQRGTRVEIQWLASRGSKSV
jgi:hypothetical protein